MDDDGVDGDSDSDDTGVDDDDDDDVGGYDDVGNDVDGDDADADDDGDGDDGDDDDGCVYDECDDDEDTDEDDIGDVVYDGAGVHDDGCGEYGYEYIAVGDWYDDDGAVDVYGDGADDVAMMRMMVAE